MSLNILIVVVSITKECFTFYIAAERNSLTFFQHFLLFVAFAYCVQQNV